MAAGTNLKYGRSRRLYNRLWDLLTVQRQGGNVGITSSHICMKTGAPANNTAADNPIALHDICVDSTNSHVYICTAYSADASATTWTQIV
jgi:hypothetical protein